MSFRVQDACHALKQAGSIKRVGMSGGIPLVVRAFQGVDKVWRVGYDGIEKLARLIRADVLHPNGYPFFPWRMQGVVRGLGNGIGIDVEGGDGGRAPLGQHEGDESGSGTDVQDVRGGGNIGPGSQQYSVGAYLHGTAVVVYGKLLELEIRIRHFLTNDE